MNSSFSFNDSQLRYGYLVCKNKIVNSWILQAMGSFNTDFKQNTLVLKRVSFDVNWIENITNVSFVSPDVRRFTVLTPTQGNGNCHIVRVFTRTDVTSSSQFFKLTLFGFLV